jgi:hypothetical protein
MRVRTLLFLPLLSWLASCRDPVAEKAKAAAAARTAVASASATAAAAAAKPTTSGLWDIPHVVERLVRSGLAPRPLMGERGERNFRVPGVVYQVGDARLTVYIFPDSVARRAVTVAVDTAALGPKTVPGRPPVLAQLIVQNNLAAVLVGGSERQQERVALALGAGLPVTP